jgi:hypothetical protein
MSHHSSLSQAIAISALLGASSSVLGAQSDSIPPLPHPVTNNAVAAGLIGTAWHLFSFLGVDTSRVWSGIRREAFAYDDASKRWRVLPPVPGPLGRLAATAQVVRSHVYLFGGYTVDAKGTEHSLDNVDIFDPTRGTWGRGAPIPTSIDDAVSGIYRDSLIYLVSGWHESDNVRLVQIYDVVHDRWSTGTPIPGPGVFGHAGAIAGNEIVYIDGVTKNDQLPKYRLAQQSWLGTIDSTHPDRIAWRSLTPHPAPGRYRAAAASCGPLVVFAGGTDNPYNYNGVGYDGVPSKPLASVIVFDTRSGVWRSLPPAPTSTMDHRALVILGNRAIIAGGMRQAQRVSGDVVRWSLTTCLLSR